MFKIVQIREQKFKSFTTFYWSNLSYWKHSDVLLQFKIHKLNVNFDCKLEVKKGVLGGA